MSRSMSASLRAACVLLIAVFASGIAHAQTTLSSERDKVGYMIGMDVAKSVAPAVPDMDMAAFQRGVDNALAGGKPLLDDAASKQVGQALMASINARKSGQSNTMDHRASEMTRWMQSASKRVAVKLGDQQELCLLA